MSAVIKKYFDEKYSESKNKIIPKQLPMFKSKKQVLIKVI